MKENDLIKLQQLLDERTMALMERESDLAERTEELAAQKEELTAALEQLDIKNSSLDQKEQDIIHLTNLLDERTMTLMERESDLAERMEEIYAQQEELTAAIEELESKNLILTSTLEKLEERNQELDQILYRCSHDLKAPMTSIVGILSILNASPLNSDQKVCIDHIYLKTVQMDDLLKSLSALAKTLNDDLHYSSFNLNSVIDACITECAHYSNYNLITFKRTHLGAGIVHSDRLLISILLNKLISNALIFRNQTTKGLITIHTKVYDTFWEVFIEDDGEGIVEVKKDLLFKMFYRGSEKSKGSGLGLYISKKITDQLGGDIGISMEKGVTVVNVKFNQNAEV